ncbi:MAG: SLC13 family permease, partial [Promethearchaeota archaeon]
LQIIIVICFLALMYILFRESKDYLIYSLAFIFIIALSSSFLNPQPPEEKNRLILAIDWEVILFLFCLFSIVEILNENKIFHQFALYAVNKFHGKPRVMFYMISLISTLIATVIEDLSIAIIFIPIVIEACRKLKINPTPYLFGVTICINLASTLTPFGSAENIIIANHFNLSLYWYLVYLGIFFVVVLAITLFLIDKLILTKYMKEYYYNKYLTKNKYLKSEITENPGNLVMVGLQNTRYLVLDRIKYPKKELKKIKLRNIKKSYISLTQKLKNSQNSAYLTNKISKKILEIKIEKKVYRKNLIGLGIFMIILTFIQQIVIAGILGLILFVFLNPIQISEGKKEPSLTRVLNRIDAKLIYFFILLFLMVHFIEEAKLTVFIEILIEKFTYNTFWLAIGILLLSSLLSGFLDDAPITILFLPIISDLLNTGLFESNPIFIGFTLGINLGGNFLPQGAACDMMTLELARKNHVKGFTYKKLTYVGGLFALLHIIIGSVYIFIFFQFFS